LKSRLVGLFLGAPSMGAILGSLGMKVRRPLPEGIDQFHMPIASIFPHLAGLNLPRLHGPPQRYDNITARYRVSTCIPPRSVQRTADVFVKQIVVQAPELRFVAPTRRDQIASTVPFDEDRPLAHRARIQSGISHAPALSTNSGTISTLSVATKRRINRNDHHSGTTPQSAICAR
jgi:hypothetical protein